jgi:hypothetical protein
MKAQIKVPTTLSEIPLTAYQEFIKLIDKSNDHELIAQRTIQIFCGLEIKDVLQIRWDSILELTNHFAELFKQKPPFQNKFKLGDIEFGFIPNLEEMSFGEYIDLESNISNVENFHKAMAVMYRPITERRKDTYQIMPYTGTEEFAEAMKYAPLDIVMGASLFFWSLGNDLVQTSLTYLEEEMKKDKKLNTTIQKGLSSLNSGDGTIQSMQSLKATLQSLMRLPDWELESASRGLHTNDKKQKLNKENLIEN